MNKNKTLLLFIILPLILFAQTRAQNSYPTTGKALVSGLDIGADRNTLSSNIGLNLGYTTLTNINITHDVWSGSHAILFNAYQALSNPSGGLNVTGNTNFSNDVGAYNGGAGSIMYFGNGGTMGFYISDASTGKDSVINWGTAEMVIKRDGKVGIGTATPSYLLDVNGTLGVSGSIGMENTNPTIQLVEEGVTDKNWDIQVNNGDFQILKVNDTRSTFENAFFISDQNQIGIGTNTTSANLHIKESSTGAPSLLIQRKGYVGGAGGETGAEFGSLIFKNDHFSDYGAMIKGVIGTNGWASAGALDFYTSSTSGYHFAMRINNDGNVGIGTDTPGNKLEVNGTIRSKEVIVEATNWPDYVFEEDYDLPTLLEIETFIKANKHLPEVPSAKEMEANGISLGEMNMLLLKKIEELTLHTIAQQKELEAERAANQKNMQELLARMQKLEEQKNN